MRNLCHKCLLLNYYTYEKSDLNSVIKSKSPSTACRPQFVEGLEVGIPYLDLPRTRQTLYMKAVCSHIINIKCLPKANGFMP